MKRLLKSKRGMSLMEILVALSLLMIVIVGTTPVMLQAYEGLYTAGEYTQNVYNAKTEVEDQLATRSSIIEYPEGFVINFENLGEVARVNAKRAVSSLKTSLETLFTGARVRIYISSGSVVDDNQSEHTLVLQTVNLAFTNDDITNEKMNNKAGVSKDGKKIDITAYLPNKAATANTAATVYTENRKAKVTVVNDTTNPDSGRIGIKISSDDYPIDFTTSPIKILVTYLDENDKVKSVYTYLTIKTPTIMFAGETNGNVQYYTTAGVVENKDKDGNVTSRTFDIEARAMNIGYNLKSDILAIGENAAVGKSANLGAASTQAVPTGTVFKSINWITEYARTSNPSGSGAGSENIEYANTCYEPEYYVLTGTNGAIYRTYTFTDPNSIKGKVDLDTTDNDILGINDLLLNNFTKKTQNGKDVMGIQDTEIYLDDRASTVVYPAVWGGDFSHIFGWSSYDVESSYTQRRSPANASGTWQTEHSTNKGTGQPGFYSNLASFGYCLNGWGMDTQYNTLASRKISYILTEVENSMRIGGDLSGSGSSSNSEYGYDGTTFDRIWERPLSLDTTQSWQVQGREWDEAYFYCVNPAGDPETKNMIRSVMIDDNDKKYNNDVLKVPVYIKNGSGRRRDDGLAQLRLKALTTLSPTFLYERLNDNNDYASDSSNDVRYVYRNDINESKITVTDAVYIPATTTTEAQVFYVGTVAAYGWINQVDNVGTDGPDVENIGGYPTRNTGRFSCYWVVSSEDGTSTAVYKTSSSNDSTFGDAVKDKGKIHSAYKPIRERLMGKSWPASSAKSNSTASRDFYIGIPVNTVNSKVFTDLSFTLGFTSNREMVYTNIAYGKVDNALAQALKSYEIYYFQSHYNNENKDPSLYMNSLVDGLHNTNDETLKYRNNADNDYYNVWFPGEMYNLTKTATKDNVTVAVGYAVSGSTYTYLNSDKNGSTGLGSIYNDGVISGMVLGNDSAFKSLLYFKDNATFDGSSLYNSSTNAGYTYTRVDNSGNGSAINSYKNLGWNYGTHARDSVQFTCVDISVVQSGDTTYYYAYYADNKGRIFRSLVATRGKDDAAAKMVDYISDKSSSPGIEDVSYMEEQTFVVGQWTMKGSNYFEKINTIAAHDDLIVITGKSKSKTTWKLNILVGVIDKENPTAAPTWKLLTWGYDNFVAHDALIRDGYLYLVGENETSPCGFILAVPLDTLRSADNNSSISGIFKDNSGDHQLKFYAIAGKE